MTMPPPTSEELDRIYGAEYSYSAHDLIEAEKRRRAAWLLQYSGIRSGRILDVGCMFGFLLDEAQRRGVETHGIELSPGPARAAEAKGHRIFTGSIEAYAAAHPGEAFDAVFAQHVLEHVEDPRSFLAAARQLLRPGGLLVVCVPNFDAPLRHLTPRGWGWYQVPVHRHHYTARALSFLLDEVGFSTLDRRTRGGDTPFLVLSVLQSLGFSLKPGNSPSRAQRLMRTTLGILGDVTRPYYALGADELVCRARPREVT